MEITERMRHPEVGDEYHSYTYCIRITGASDGCVSYEVKRAGSTEFTEPSMPLSFFRSSLSNMYICGFVPASTDTMEWLNPMLRKRSIDAVHIFLDLIQAGMLRGEVSANDVKHRELAEPNIIGGVFKVLHKFGFRHTDRRVKSTGKQKHARRVDVWEVESYSKLNAAKKEITNVLANIEPQPELF